MQIGTVAFPEGRTGFMCLNRLKCQVIVSIVLLASWPLLAQETPFSDLSPDQQLSEDILRELVSYESSNDRPDLIEKALQTMATRLLAAGFTANEVQVLNPSPNNYGMLVRYRGIGPQKPLLVLAHIDVVQAVPDQWAFPPFVLGKKDGYYLGRGTADNKAGVAEIISNFIRLKREGWLPGRDIVAAISGNEETSGDFAKWLAGEGRQLADAEFAINTDAGGGEYDESGKRLALWVQTSEKLCQTYQLTTVNRGGHSSQPRPDNAIRDLAEAITRVGAHTFPVILNDTTRMALRRSATLYPEHVGEDMLALAENEGDLAAAQRLSDFDPGFNAMLRPTCVPTQLSGGHAENALPREANVTVNCRILPSTEAIEIEKVIAGLVDGLGVDIEIIYDGLASDVSVLPDALMEQIESLSEAHFGDIPVIPGMSTGAPDGLFFRNAGIPVYGISALFSKPGESGAHGLDEKIGIEEFHQSVEFLYQLLMTMAQ